MNNVFVTGGAGYIGSHTCKLLSRSGYNPIVYDNLSTGHKEFVKWGELVVGDLLDTEKLVDAITKASPIAVIHFAASAYIGESLLNPYKYYQNNVGGTLSLLRAMKFVHVEKLVFSSTCATYGISEKSLIDEEAPQFPINPYGKSKLIIEEILRDLSYINEIQYVALRYFNAAGADSEGEIGELHKPETHLIPLAIMSARGAAQLKVFGNDFLTPDGTAIRDYIHVEDLARGHLNALRYLLTGGGSTSINLGTGSGASVLQIINNLKGLGVDVNYEFATRRGGDPASLVANSNKANIILGWTPEYTSILDILKSAVRWHMSGG